MSLNTEVAIIGGGIGGLTLGLKLAQANLDVTVLEKLDAPSSVYKGELLQPKSLKIFNQLGALDEILDNGFSFSRIAFEEGEKEFAMDYSILPGNYDYSLMIEHERLKGILLNQALQYSNFHYLSGSLAKGYDKGQLLVERKDVKEQLTVRADFFIGAEGRNSITRKEMNSKIKKIEYNHQFLTVTFPRPQSLEEGKIISKDERFLGLFPLPDAKVRSVYLIPEGTYKEHLKKGIHYFHKNYVELFPELEGYVTRLKNWKDIQLMIPTAFYADKYVDGRLAILGDAAHTVHPMAGEGMNMAIQDADVLGELLAEMYASGRNSPDRLKWYEKVRKPRAENMISLSHLSAIAYSYSNRVITGIRRKGLKQIERDKTLQYKQMLNVSGLGYWPESLWDRLIQAGMLPARKTELSASDKSHYFYTEKEDYPWKKVEQP
ncbi:FAD-dependent oxidoreductase [Paenibacillus sp. FSL R5-0490]|uniref:FAD-dependent oxidoreductase n=1 Tax=Paenibacillus sp. FSL R5-0490 TaxID=1920424 RepID=UPI00096D8588|nr:NAD(P)/FAD-dependent oxidoreductase [Paenibacillus sp. FSL R5-0490]OMF56556.1 FAD-dependent oxidoreductase [Paenibacillus sp. FSL R5-0490]